MIRFHCEPGETGNLGNETFYDKSGKTSYSREVLFNNYLSQERVRVKVVNSHEIMMCCV